MLKKLFIITVKILIGWLLASLLLVILSVIINVENKTDQVLISDNEAIPIALLTIFISIGIPVWAIISTLKKKDVNNPYKTRKKKKAPPRERHLNGLFSQHKAHLVRNFNRSIIPNEYGAVDIKSIDRWRGEIIRFLESVDLPEYLFKKNIHFEQAIEYIDQQTQIYIQKLEENGDASVDFTNITDPNLYEVACAKELEIHGWQVQVSPVGADQGIDVRAFKGGLSVVLQCKLYSNAVGNKAVQEAISGKAFDNADVAAVVAPNGYTRSALELAQSTNVLLLSHSDLKNLYELIARP